MQTLKKDTVYSKAQYKPQQLHPQDKKSSSFNKDSRRVCELPSQKLSLLHRKAQEWQGSQDKLPSPSVMALLQMFFSLLNKNQQTQQHLGKQS